MKAWIAEDICHQCILKNLCICRGTPLQKVIRPGQRVVGWDSDSAIDRGTSGD